LSDSSKKCALTEREPGIAAGPVNATKREDTLGAAIEIDGERYFVWQSGQIYRKTAANFDHIREGRKAEG
jgi:hypothetical protein